MFNNPFDSFHDTVAEAKKEREQLDRLLTISTPRERLLVAVIALVLLILAAWLFLGRVALGVALDGVLVEPSENAAAGNRSVEALVWVESPIAPRIETGMPAVLELTMTDGATRLVRGEVATIVAVPMSEALAQAQSAAPVSLYRISIAIDEGVDVASFAGSESRIVIELGRQAPVTFFGIRRP